MDASDRIIVILEGGPRPQNGGGQDPYDVLATGEEEVFLHTKRAT